MVTLCLIKNNLYMDSINNGCGQGCGHTIKTFALIALVFVALVYGFARMAEMRYIGTGVSATNTISVSGEGEVFAAPDIATFMVTIREEAKTVEVAQEAATEKSNNVLATLRAEGVEEKDIKTINYNINPQYDYVREASCDTGYCPGNQVLRGYEVYQSLQVKVRDTSTAGGILTKVGKDVSDVSGLSFTFDDDDALQEEARADAIADAQNKAEKLARDLGVSLVRVVGFSEGYDVPKYARAEVMMMAMDEESSMGGAAPELPVGENKVTSSVTITYEIK